MYKDKIKYFNYLKIAHEMNVPKKILKDIKDEFKKEFPNDEMMYELHVLRALMSGYWKKEINV